MTMLTFAVRLTERGATGQSLRSRSGYTWLSRTRRFMPRPDSSVVERGPEKAGVGGSIPSLATIFSKSYKPLSILVQALMSVMVAVRHHYDGVAREVAVEGPMRMENLAEPLIIIPVDRWSRISEKALRFAMKLSDQVQAVHVDAEECYEEVSRNWQQNVGGPFARAGRAVPELVFLESPYRFVLTPLLDYIGKVERECPDRQIAVLVPELVVKHWWQTPLHNQRARMLKMLLTVQRNHRIMVISLPWYL